MPSFSKSGTFPFQCPQHAQDAISLSDAASRATFLPSIPLFWPSNPPKRYPIVTHPARKWLGCSTRTARHTTILVPSDINKVQAQLQQGIHGTLSGNTFPLEERQGKTRWYYMPSSKKKNACLKTHLPCSTGRRYTLQGSRGTESGPRPRWG